MSSVSKLQRIGLLLWWPVGMALTSWRYLWRITPVHRTQEEGGPEDLPPPIPEGFRDCLLQPAEAGLGSLYHRTYRVHIDNADGCAQTLMARFAANPNRISPREVAVFRKRKGASDTIDAGDEYVIRMPGVWNGPIRVVDQTPTSFRCATLDGHLEAGQIEFSARDEGGGIAFQIESWARSGDRLAFLLYEQLRLAKEMQLNMWVHVCERTASLVSGSVRDGVHIHTRRTDVGHRDQSREPRRASSRSTLEQARAAELNFDPADLPTRTSNGWRVGTWRQPLPSEPPGAPEADGPWERARRLIETYEFADPRIVRAVYPGHDPLPDDVMLLKIGLGPIRVRGCVRVTGPRDEVITIDGQPVQIWGWYYQTLMGHPEQGRMSYEVWKWLESGHVEFRVHRVARWAETRNPLLAIATRLVGHQLMRWFVRSSCERILHGVRETSPDRLP